VAKGRYENDDKYNVLCPDCGAVTLVDDWQSESVCDDCGHGFVPKEGNVSRGGKYNCPDCGQKYAIVDAIQEQGGYDMRLYGVEYYCEHCDEMGEERSAYKGYKQAEQGDVELFEEAQAEWETSNELHEYVPDEEIPPGHMTSERNPVFDHGYEEWMDLFTKRQLLCLSKVLKSIDSIEDDNTQEFLLLAFSDSIRYNNTFVTYNNGYNKADHSFKQNSFVPTTDPVENNVWGTKFGSGPFSSIWEKLLKGVEYANSPSERYVDEQGETKKITGFSTVDDSFELRLGDARELPNKNEYEAVITDPPYYDNIMYSEVSDFFYIWLKPLLKGKYPGFDQKRPHAPNPSSRIHSWKRPPRTLSRNLRSLSR